MLTVEDCLRKAFAALLRGDLKERDAYVGMAQNLYNAADRKAAGYPAEEVVQTGAPIRLGPPKKNA